MKKYILQDENYWLSTNLYDTIEEAIERAEFLLNLPSWKNCSYFDIKVIDLEINKCLYYRTVFRK